ncbi:unnamed protein product [Mycena citricolor]|uniref:Uncharacterized protein n=1 Tax=Mycena citricolor TaxID=2018698 RepID=A0AAD2K7H7_9AGAR|nr:unnamed protein product [Mycena citricolor]
MAKIDELYEKTSNSHAYMIAMVPHPAYKMDYFHNHWPLYLQRDAEKALEQIVRDCSCLTFRATEISCSSVSTMNSSMLWQRPTFWRNQSPL